MKVLLALQPSQPHLRILNLKDTRISIFPEIEEFLVMIFGFDLPAFIFFKNLNNILI